jgi:8-oxo-dGTP diphosphatase
MTADQSPFGNKVRVRVCGLLIRNGEILLAQIHSPVTNNLIWTPPGGGLQFGEPIEECLKREFKEETNLSVKVGDLFHVNELVRKPHHAIECYFEVKQVGGKEKIGKDPELTWDRQLLHDLQWIAIEELSDINFVPPALVKKIQNLDKRNDFPLFSEQE